MLQYALLVHVVFVGTVFLCNQDSSVGIATLCGLNGPGIESWWWDEVFLNRPDRTWDAPSVLCNGHHVFFPGEGEGVLKRPGRGINHPHTSIVEVKERLELYLYSPFGP
jgi:hypothetical protein